MAQVKVRNKDSFENKLDSFDASERCQARGEAAKQTSFPSPDGKLNMHLHSFYSYNAGGYSPSHLAYSARNEGFLSAGLVDFDVLDGLEEFYAAGDEFRLPVSVGLESRVFVPEFSDCVINSPGEPGIAYHIGMGFPKVPVGGIAGDFLNKMRNTASRRTRELLERVNRYLDPLVLDFDNDVRPLTPAGNATERHLCEAFVRKAASKFPDPSELAGFWEDKLGMSRHEMDLPTGPNLQDAIRKKTMKKGGVGYIQPDQGSFPSQADMNRFILEAGGIPVIAWLDGTTEGEQDMEKLCRTAMDSGAAALNIIPARNYTSGVKDEKLENLYEVIELCRNLKLPVLAGTEMNSPSTPFVNDFNCPELKPLWGDFYNGAMVIIGHTAMQRQQGRGYLSSWADDNFANIEEKQSFYAEIGRSMQSVDDENLPSIANIA